MPPTPSVAVREREFGSICCTYGTCSQTMRGRFAASFAWRLDSLALEKLKRKNGATFQYNSTSNSKSLKKVCQTFKSELSKSGRSEERKKAGNRLEQRPRWYTH